MRNTNSRLMRIGWLTFQISLWRAVSLELVLRMQLACAAQS